MICKTATNTRMGDAVSQDLPKVLLLKTPTVFLSYEHQLSRHFHFLKAYDTPHTPPDEVLAAAAAAGVSAALLGGSSRFDTAGLLDRVPSLRLIVCSSAGLNHIDLPECRRRGVAVTYAGESQSDDCAEFAVGLLLDVLRKVSAGDRFVRDARWSVGGSFPLGHRLRGKRIGIVGLGSIGSRIATSLAAFGCTILYSATKQKRSVPYAFYSDVCEMAASSDVLVVSCALTERTKHLINEQVLSALGKEGVLINIARGQIIDERELVRHLQEGRIAGAGLDVYENEPSVPKELLSMDNVVLSPHVAFCTEEALSDLFELVKGNLLAFFSNEPLLSPVPTE